MVLFLLVLRKRISLKTVTDKLTVAVEATSPETEPELIEAIGVDGTEGYVLKKDLDGEQPSTPEEAIAQQKSKAAEGRDIPLYDMDGENMIGVFRVGGN